MSERITSIEIDTSVAGSTLSQMGVSFSGFSYDVVSEEKHGRITKVTGLEAPSMNVTGGSSSFGGSVYTGVTLSDREVVLTVKPTGLTNKQIKNRLNALITTTNNGPLTFRIRTTQEDYTESFLWASAYISGVSSPIFDKDDTVQITVKMGRPYFERPPMVLQRQYAPGLPERPIAHTLLSENFFAGTHTFKYSVSPPVVSVDSMNAESPFSIQIEVANMAVLRVRNISVWDQRLNKVDVSYSPGYYETNVTNQPLFLEVNAMGRSARTNLVETGSGRHYEIQQGRGFRTHIRPNWPSLMPGSEEIIIEMETGSINAPDPLNLIKVEQLIVWPRMLGL